MHTTPTALGPLTLPAEPSVRWPAPADALSEFGAFPGAKFATVVLEYFAGAGATLRPFNPTTGFAADGGAVDGFVVSTSVYAADQ
eukprot:4950647-Pyramimonas_sp.AAC.1